MKADLLETKGLEGQALELIRVQPGTTTVDVARKLKVSMATAVDTLHKLLADGLVERRLGKRLYQYYIAGEGPAKVVA